VSQREGAYEHGGGSRAGGSGSAGLNPLQRMLRRAGSRRENLVVVEDYNLTAGGRRGMTQPRIDTGSWTQKGKNARESFGFFIIDKNVRGFLLLIRKCSDFLLLIIVTN
jgi:hypothetical protein